jgi:hypothetical protein
MDPGLGLDSLRGDALGAWPSGGWDDAPASGAGSDPGLDPSADPGSPGAKPAAAAARRPALQPDWSMYGEAGGGAGGGLVRGDGRRRRRGGGAGRGGGGGDGADGMLDPLDLPTSLEERSWVEGPLNSAPWAAAALPAPGACCCESAARLL